MRGHLNLTAAIEEKDTAAIQTIGNHSMVIAHSLYAQLLASAVGYNFIVSIARGGDHWAELLRGIIEQFEGRWLSLESIRPKDVTHERISQLRASLAGRDVLLIDDTVYTGKASIAVGRSVHESGGLIAAILAPLHIGYWDAADSPIEGVPFISVFNRDTALKHSRP